MAGVYLRILKCVVTRVERVPTALGNVVVCLWFLHFLWRTYTRILSTLFSYTCKFRPALGGKLFLIALIQKSEGVCNEVSNAMAWLGNF